MNPFYPPSLPPPLSRRKKYHTGGEEISKTPTTFSSCPVTHQTRILGGSRKHGPAIGILSRATSFHQSWGKSRTGATQMVPSGSHSRDTIVSSSGPCRSRSHQPSTGAERPRRNPENAPAHYSPYHNPAPIASTIFGLSGVDINPSWRGTRTITTSPSPDQAPATVNRSYLGASRSHLLSPTISGSAPHDRSCRPI
jgi:hypothetical protein